MRKQLIEALETLLVTHAPGGQEEEIDAVIRDVLNGGSAEVSQDAHGNITACFPGTEPGPLTVVSAHKDELSVVVRKIDDDGRMWLEPVGGSRPSKYGEGPFDLITRQEVIEGVLSFGSTHSSALSPRINQGKSGLLTWDLVYLDCKLTGEQLKARGAMVGDRAVIGRRRKAPMFMHDTYVGGYALDDKAAVAVLLLLAEQLDQAERVRNVCLAFTAAEEGGVSGGCYLAHQLDPCDFIAVEVAPIAEEYPLKMNEQPVLLFKDALYHYSTPLTRELLDAGARCGLECQTAVVRSFGSDASVAVKAGLIGRAACLCFPTENTHGYEVASLPAMENCVKLLYAYLTGQQLAG